MGDQKKRDDIAEAEGDYQRWRASLVDTPEKQAAYDDTSFAFFDGQ